MKTFTIIDKHTQRGFTIVEIIVATLVFTIAAAGVLTTISSINQSAAESSDTVEAVYLGKRILEDLRRSVDAEIWNNGGALDPAGNPHVNTYTIENIEYIVCYNVVDDPDNQGRLLNMSITWDGDDCS